MLASSHHGRGIMTSAIRAILHDWAIPHMRVRTVMATADADNLGSLRVFAKNNFQYMGTVVNEVDMSHKGRNNNILGVMKWTATDGV